MYVYAYIYIYIYIHTQGSIQFVSQRRFEETSSKVRFSFFYLIRSCSGYLDDSSESLMTSLEKGRVIRVPIRRIVSLYVSI